MTNNPGTLYVVATPIGNLDDISARAREVLSKADVVAAEDTRRAGQLLTRLGFRRRLLSLHEHNESERVQQLIDVLVSGGTVALISDAGTPLINDPGYRLLAAARDRGLPVSPIPGCCAAIAAISVAGLPTDRFFFEGFLPAKNAARLNALSTLAAETRTLVFYESVHRIAESLRDMEDVFGEDRPAFLGRELTKLHEQCVQDSIGVLAQRVEDGSIVNKGEFVVVVAGAKEAEESSIDVDRLLLELIEYMPGKEAAAITARATGKKRNALYQRLLDLKKS